MVKRQARHLRREFTPEEELRWQRAVKETEAEKEAILAVARRVKRARSRTKPTPPRAP